MRRPTRHCCPPASRPAACCAASSSPTCQTATTTSESATMPHRIPTTTTGRHQRGAILFVALVFLILITLLALTATGTSILQEKMTGGMRNRQLGLMGSESGLRGGEALFTTAGYMGSNPLPKCASAPTASSVCAYAVAQASLSTATSTGAQLSPTVQSFRTTPSWVAAPGGTPVYSHTLT